MIYPTSVFTWPASQISMVPPHLHAQVESFVSAAWPAIATHDEPGTHGFETIGSHGCGDLADATFGLDRVVHSPNGLTLTVGW
jgi:hypothetical protein